MMQAQAYENVTLDVCPGCGAVFFDQGELDSVSQKKANVESMLAEAASAPQSRGSGRSCPRCRGDLTEARTKVFAFDLCGKCSGLFLSFESIRALFLALDRPVPTFEHRFKVAREVPESLGDLLFGEFNGIGPTIFWT